MSREGEGVLTRQWWTCWNQRQAWEGRRTSLYRGGSSSAPKLGQGGAVARSRDVIWEGITRISGATSCQLPGKWALSTPVPGHSRPSPAEEARHTPLYRGSCTWESCLPRAFQRPSPGNFVRARLSPPSEKAYFGPKGINRDTPPHLRPSSASRCKLPPFPSPCTPSAILFFTPPSIPNPVAPSSLSIPPSDLNIPPRKRANTAKSFQRAPEELPRLCDIKAWAPCLPVLSSQQRPADRPSPSPDLHTAIRRLSPFLEDGSCKLLLFVPGPPRATLIICLEALLYTPRPSDDAPRALGSISELLGHRASGCAVNLRRCPRTVPIAPRDGQISTRSDDANTSPLLAPALQQQQSGLPAQRGRAPSPQPRKGHPDRPYEGSLYSGRSRCVIIRLRLVSPTPQDYRADLRDV